MCSSPVLVTFVLLNLSFLCSILLTFFYLLYYVLSFFHLLFASVYFSGIVKDFLINK